MQGLLPFSQIYVLLFFFFNDTATTEIYTLSLHDALPILTAHSLMRKNNLIFPATANSQLGTAADMVSPKVLVALINIYTHFTNPHARHHL